MQPFTGTNPRSILMLDNASTHHVDNMTQLVSRIGAIIRFLQEYSPDFMPLEEVFSKVKYFLRENGTIYD